MNKLKIAPLALSLLAITLAGCGGEDDGNYGSGGSSNEFTVSSFDRSSNAIARIDTTYRTGNRDVEKTNIVGSYNQNIDNLETSVVLADKFEGTLEDKNIEVNERTVKRPIYEKNSSNKFGYETTYRTLDLSGVDARDFSAGNSFDNRRGFLTDLNNYPEIPNNIGFPNGSVCYIPVTTSDRSFFVFNNNKTGYQTLGKWADAVENSFNDNRQSITTELNIGSGNQQEATQVKFLAVNNDPEYLYNGIDYDSSVYEAKYVNKDQSPPNEDSGRGVIDCTLVNDRAADFLAEQIDRYY